MTTTTAVQPDGVIRRPNLAFAVLLGLLLSLFPGIQHAHAAPDADAEARFVSLLNAERANAGLPALKVAGELTTVARRHSVRMAESGKLHHNPNLGSEVSGWDKVGENVGRGPSVDSVHAAFMASDGHRRNILDPEWTEVGVGVEVVDGGLWVTEIFRLPSGASAPKPEPEPKPEPKPAPKTATQPETGSTAAPSASAPGATADPAATAEPPAPEPHAVPDVPLPLDRVSIVLARLDAADEHLAVDDADA